MRRIRACQTPVSLMTAMLLLGCNPVDEPASAPATRSAASSPTTPATAGDAEILHNAQARASSSQTLQLDSIFSGKALEAVQRDSQAAPQSLVEQIAAHANEIARAEKCSLSSHPEATRLIDLDADGERDAISFYSLSGCGNNAVIRILSVLRLDESGNWQPVMNTALSIRPNDVRPILDLGNGTITISGGRNGFGGMNDPEVLDIPLAPTQGESGVLPND